MWGCGVRGCRHVDRGGCADTALKTDQTCQDVEHSIDV